MNSLSNYYVRIHSNVADKASATKLWYYCRMCSDNGRATVNLLSVAQFFGVTVRTVRYWLSWCVQHKYIRHHHVDNTGECVVYYSALTTVCDGFIGSVATVDLSQRQDLKVVAAESVAQQLQKVAQFAAKHNWREQKQSNPFQRTVKPIARLFDSTPSELKALGVLGETNRYLLLDHNYTHYGVCYDFIAQHLDRSVSTVQRRLRNTHKKQIAQHKNEFYAEQFFAEEEGHNKRFIYAKVTRKNNNVVQLLFKALTNVYYPSLELNSMRYRKRAVASSMCNR